MSAVLFSYAEVTSRDFPYYEQASKAELWADREVKCQAYIQYVELESDSQAWKNFLQGWPSESSIMRRSSAHDREYTIAFYDAEGEYEPTYSAVDRDIDAYETKIYIRKGSWVKGGATKASQTGNWKY